MIGRPGAPHAGDPLHVLAVDRSTAAREGLRVSLGRHTLVRLTLAQNTLVAQSKIERDLPDVILLGANLGHEAVLSFVGEIRCLAPIPVVIWAAEPVDVQLVLKAMALGAVDVIGRPADDEGSLLDAAPSLVIALRTAARRQEAALRAHRPVRAPAAITGARHGLSRFLVVIGASTGGTEAILAVLEGLTPPTPGVLVVQHLPAAFTGAFANRLDRELPVAVREAEDGEPVIDNQVLLAPGGHHLEVRRDGLTFRAQVTATPAVNGHRPSVDVLFRSAAKAAGADAVGVLLTGMGDDGADGLLDLRKTGAMTLAQDEASCVVFGMPMRAIARGAACAVVPLTGMARAVTDALRERAKDSRFAP